MRERSCFIQSVIYKLTCQKAVNHTGSLEKKVPRRGNIKCRDCEGDVCFAVSRKSKEPKVNE